jgi:hypothetical protein
MVSAVFIVKIVVAVIMGGMCGLFCYKFAQFKSELEVVPCPKAEVRVEYTASSNGVVVPADAIPKCDPAKDGPKVFEHCLASPYTDRTYLHHFAGSVPDDIFPWLHHPSSPAKDALIITESPKWDTHEANSKQIITNNCAEIYMTRTGSRSNQPNKCVAVVRVPQGVTSIVQNSHRYGFTALLTDQYLNDYARANCFEEELMLLHPFADELPKLRQTFMAKMGSPFDGTTRRTAIIMVANEGVVDLLLNFLCSAEQSNIDLSNIMVFVGSESDAQLVEGMGVHAMYGAALGSMPVNAAKGYLDNTFARMMWYKTTSVYLAVASGFDVLFQDVDLVWMQDPIPYLKALDADISFMDDGARTPRYTPLFVNSGFFYIKYNERTLYFQVHLQIIIPFFTVVTIFVPRRK